MCSKVILEKSPLKIYHFPCGLLLNLHSSDEGKTIYTDVAQERKKPWNGVGEETGGENLKNYSVSHFNIKDLLEP